MIAAAQLFPMPSSADKAVFCARAISLTQPWATLMATGEKRYETRSWGTKYLGPLAIHAAAGFPREARALCGTEPFRRVLRQHGYVHADELPLGQVLALVDLLGCHAVESVRDFVGEEERAFGDYTDGRYAWRTANVRKLKRPLPMRGALSVWTMPQAITEADL